MEDSRSSADKGAGNRKEEVGGNTLESNGDEDSNFGFGDTDSEEDDSQSMEGLSEWKGE